MRKIPIADWLKEAEERFGTDKRNWKFRCANCGHIQSVADFIELNEQGISKADPASVVCFSCIGRFDSRLEKVGTLGDKIQQPCDYTLGGLFCLAETCVIDPEGKEHPVFEFAPAEETGQ